MEKTIELPLPEDLKSLIQKYATDKVGIHPTASLIYSVRMFETNDKTKFKVVMAGPSDYFIVLRDGKTATAIYRGYDIINSHLT